MKNSDVKEIKPTINIEVKETNRFNRVFSIILVVLVSIIALSIILFTFIPKNFNIGVNDPTLIILHTSNAADSTTNSITLDGNSNEYKSVLDLYKKSFSSSMLSSLFQGKAFNKVEIKEGYKSLAESVVNSDNYLEFRYDESQVLKINGKTYTAESISDTNYISIFIEIFDSNSLVEINAYMKYKDTGINEYSYLRFVTYASQAKLFSYIKSI